MNELKLRLKKMIVERLFLPILPAEIADDAPLMETYDIDSVALFELVVGLEDEFGISLEDADFQVSAFQSVNSMAAFVSQKSG
ncbi:acyl carrier protein [Abditibacterium utsteinense]|uniref:Acyl carrier protein n=1 Tax=Abditibacterium utsteinense TaxID=1960156 RepID=A0A2S8SW03_9BACT|nr:acyl carrier protein [Abditibacterium utsteinense]PQV64981.1 acyl carrier protein [Abditibacterium utsteinense]